MGPVAMLRPPPGTSSQTQPDGRSVYSVFALRLGQRGIAPLCARPLYELSFSWLESWFLNLAQIDL